MSGWTPVPDKLKDQLFLLAKKHNKKAALELYLLAKTCRRPGWEGLMPGQVRITETQVSELLGMTRGGAHKVLVSVMQEAGLTRLDSNVLAWEAGMEAGKDTIKVLKTLEHEKPVEAGKEAVLEAVSITILQDSKRKSTVRSAHLSPEEEKTIENGLQILGEIYPKKFYDGQASHPYSKSLTREKIRKLAPVHGVMVLLEAMERYYEVSKKNYFKAPQNFLGPKGPYLDYLEAM